MFPELKGKLLFVFSDPGGAKPLLALAEKYTESIVVSDREHPFYKDFKVQVHIAVSNYEKIINQHAPHLVVTGTSYRSDIEKKFHQLCAQINTPCYAFIDHWTSMRLRFEQPDGSLLIPDKICVLDDRARQLAIAAGIPAEKTVVSGNPYHTWLAHWKPNISKQDFLEQAAIGNTRANLLLYAPDPLSNVNGKETFGFDEIEATQQLSKAFDSGDLRHWVLLIKAHPNQSKEAIRQFIDNKACYLLTDEIDTNTALYYADAVLGFFSNILIEASILNKPVLRYLPVEVANDPIAALQIGTCTNRAQLPGHLHALSHIK